jgi:hypothetical protein
MVEEAKKLIAAANERCSACLHKIQTDIHGRSPSQIDKGISPLQDVDLSEWRSHRNIKPALKLLVLIDLMIKPD